MSIATILLILVALLIGGWWWVRYAQPAIRRARAYSARVSTCGYLADPPKPGWVRFLKRLAAVFAGLQAGKITVEGIENLPGNDSASSTEPVPFMVCPNHPHYVDPAVMIRVLNRPVRF